ncbi:uncharacterized protein LOC135226087 [Macrobrachium nipponense]|uniref:uncharacterized protein LOC135226087 n=1 Tax=Macrobrachium nipponense TaxID=159736 RepID=UPI0030C88580
MTTLRIILWLLCALGRGVASQGNENVEDQHLKTIGSYFQNNENGIMSFLNNLNIGNTLNLGRAHTVRCGGQSSSRRITWQSDSYPRETMLPRWCTLRVSPRSSTCGYRVHFEDVDTATPRRDSITECDVTTPSFRLAHGRTVSWPLCSGLTGFEGIVEMKASSEEGERDPITFLLTLNPTVPSAFSINVEEIACGNLTGSYRSPNHCGIKNPSDNSRQRALRQEDEDGRTELSASIKQGRTVPEAETGAEDEKLSAIPTVKNSKRIEIDEDSDAEDSDATKRQRSPEEKIKKRLMKILKRRSDPYSKALTKRLRGDEAAVNTSPTWAVEEEAEVNEYPWMVAIRRSNFSDGGGTSSADEAIPSPCSGVLLSDIHVLTSVECLITYTSGHRIAATSLSVLVGDHDLNTRKETESREVPVAKVIFSFDYSPVNYRESLAVVKLKQAVRMNRAVRPVCLPLRYNTFLRTSLVAGWHNTMVNRRKVAASLMVAEVELADESVCNTTVARLDAVMHGVRAEEDEEEDWVETVPSFNRNDYVCAGVERNANPICSIGSGAPLIRQDTSGAYYVTGIGTPVNVCGHDLTSLFVRVQPESSFLSLALRNETSRFPIIWALP